MPQPASRMQRIPEHVFVEINAKIANLRSNNIDVVRLDIGNPDMPPPQAVIDELSRSADLSTTHGYSGYRGIPEFREAVANYYKRQFDVDLDSEVEILPLIGTKEGIANLTFAYISEGDGAIIPDIAYPTYAMATLLAGGQIEHVPTEPNMLVESVLNLSSDVSARSKLLWVNYPNNPTGWISPSQMYESLVDYCIQNDILLVSDNPYMGITYNNLTVPSLLQTQHARKCGVEFFSLSKTYNMAGWRIGAAVGNADAIRNLLKMKSNVDSGHFVPIYHAASFALNNIDQSWISERNAIYQARRDKLVSALSNIGMTITSTDATLYLWAKVPQHYQEDDASFVNNVLEQAHVSIAPGSAYGPGGVGFVRVAVSADDAQIDEAIRRLSYWHTNQE